MKKLTEWQGINEGRKLDIQRGTVNWAPAADLRKYLEVCNKVLSPDVKALVNWLIVNNDTYIHDLENTRSENILAGFYEGPAPSDPYKKELYTLIGKAIKAGDKLQIPLFLTQEQFDDIINKKVSPDSIMLDLDTEAGRSAVYKKYQPLLKKIAFQWKNKINLPYDDIVGCCEEGLTYAMNTYGKQNDKSNASYENVKDTSFGSWAAYMMLNSIRGRGVDDSHLVRIPKTVQRKEREARGSNTRTYSQSGDAVKSIGNDGDTRTLFDTIGSGETAGHDIELHELQEIWKEIYNIIDTRFKGDKKCLDIFYKLSGLHGYDKVSNKDLANEYGMVKSNITYYYTKVQKFIEDLMKKDQGFRDKMLTARDLTATYNASLDECVDIYDHDFLIKNEKHADIYIDCE